MSLRSPRLFVASLLSLVAVGALSFSGARAQDVPKAIARTIDGTEMAANNRNLKRLLDTYAKDFSHTDGLDAETLGASLQQLWERYPELTYDIELVSWEDTDRGLEYETITRISGSSEREGRPLRLEATLRSRQRLQKGRIIFQEVLAESTQVTLGDRPPLVRVSLPEAVAPGERYSFDIIALESLDDGVLLGAATEEPVDRLNYLSDRDLDLDILPAGGLYLVGMAPEEPGDRWLSATIVRSGGIVFIGRRLRVVSGRAAR